MPVSAHREPLNMGTTLASRIMQYSSKDSWLNWSTSVTISSSSSSSSLPWEALLSDRLELDWSSLKFRQTVVSQLHSQHYVTMLEVTLSTQGWKGPCWILDHFLHLPLVIQRTLPMGPFLGCVLWVGELKVLKRKCLSERYMYDPIIVEGNSEQKFCTVSLILCLLATKLEMEQNPNLFPRCTWLGIWPKYNLKVDEYSGPSYRWSLLGMPLT